MHTVAIGGGSLGLIQDPEFIIEMVKPKESYILSLRNYIPTKAPPTY